MALLSITLTVAHKIGAERSFKKTRICEPKNDTNFHVEVYLRYLIRSGIRNMGQ